MPTLMVAIAVPILIGFGVWQLQRAEWKAGLLAELERNRDAPLVVLSPGILPEGLQFRTVQMQLDCPPQQPRPRAGRNKQGASGYAMMLTCEANGEPILLNAGWSPRPDTAMSDARTVPIQGVLVKAGPDQAARWLLVAVEATPPLLPSAPPDTDSISDNHISYAIQWFSFAAILAVIYGLWLHRRLARGGNPA